LTGGRGVDHVLEVGGKDTLGRALTSLCFGGQLHLIGGVSGFSTDLPLGPMAQSNARVRRIFVGSVSMLEAMNRALSLHKVHPVVDRTFRFDEVRRALELMQTASHFGKDRTHCMTSARAFSCEEIGGQRLEGSRHRRRIASKGRSLIATVMF
jgi:NADPH:quinone reductase-like Zn-dependent oxidoreductase